MHLAKITALMLLIAGFLEIFCRQAAAADPVCVPEARHLRDKPKHHYGHKVVPKAPGTIWQSLISPRISNELDDVGTQSGTRVEWVQPPLVVAKPENEFSERQLSAAVNMFADSVPLDAEVYIPTLDRVSMIYEGALYDPTLTTADAVGLATSPKIAAARKIIFNRYPESADILAVPSTASVKARSRLVGDLEEGTDLVADRASFDNVLPNLSTAFEKWKKEESNFLASAENLRTTYRVGISEALWEAKLSFESHLDLAGGVTSNFSPPLSSWFSTDDWHLLSPGAAGTNSVWVKQVKIERPWMNLRLLKVMRTGREQKHEINGIRTRVADGVFRESVLRLPVAFILIGSGTDAEGPNNAAIAAIVVQTETF